MTIEIVLEEIEGNDVWFTAKSTRLDKNIHIGFDRVEDLSPENIAILREEAMKSFEDYEKKYGTVV